MCPAREAVDDYHHVLAIVAVGTGQFQDVDGELCKWGALDHESMSALCAAFAKFLAARAAADECVDVGDHFGAVGPAAFVGCERALEGDEDASVPYDVRVRLA
jgi:hypothetical protein